MKIGLVSTLIHPLREPFVGGAEVLTAQLAEALARRGHEVSVLCLPGSQLDRVRLVHPTTQGQNILWPKELDALDARTYDRLIARELAWFAEGLLTLSRSVEVLHNNSHDTLALFAAATLNTPMLTTLHMAPFLPGMVEMLSALKRAGDEVPVVTVSHEVAVLWARAGIDAPVVENGVDVAALPFHEAERRGALFVGRMVEGKGPADAIAIARAAGLPLTLVGPIQEQAYFEEHVRPALGPGVTFRGHLPRSEVLQLMSRAQVMLVTPQLEEAGSIAVLEAMGCGTPVVAYDRGSLRSQVGTRGGCVVPAGEVTLAAKAIAEAIQLSPREIRAYVHERFDLRRTVDHYEKLYAALLEA